MGQIRTHTGTLVRCFLPTSLMRVVSRENSEEATASGVGIRHHLHEHLVARGNEGPWLERPTKATQPLSVDMAAVHVHVIIATQVVALQIDKAE